MDTCDVLIVGGGPAGSACAWKLALAGLDVIVVDREVFPRDKVCAGWITPRVLRTLDVDADAYRERRTFQPITGFRTGQIGSPRVVETRYDHPVSFGIRRREFDFYLLERSRARTSLGAAVDSIEWQGGRWVVNGAFSAAMLVGAGGHRCPVARRLNPGPESAPLVVAQEVEFPIPPDEERAWLAAPGIPELYFCRDLLGYGWCLRKEQYLNIGLGRFDGHQLPRARAEFIAFLESQGRIPAGRLASWQGHAYRASVTPTRRLVDEAVMAIGDAAGLADPTSGEGIGPAVESGLLAASTIIGAAGRYTRERLEPYARTIQQEFRANAGPSWRAPVKAFAARLSSVALDSPWFVRHVLLDRWFLHA